jgi:hypothetical protein
MIMRELAKCIAWTIAFGAPALVAAAFAGGGLAQADGIWALIVFLVYSPFYLLGHAFSPDAAQTALPESTFDAAVFVAQFLYFFMVVAAVRYFHRKRAGSKA